MAVGVGGAVEHVPEVGEGNAGRKSGDEHEEIGDDDHGDEHLGGNVCPFEGEEVEVETEDGHFGAEEGEQVHEDAIPGRPEPGDC